MKFNLQIPPRLKLHYDAELNQYLVEFKAKNLSKAWRHLERAHIIGQSYPMAHTIVHWKMLKFGFVIKNTKEIVGQIPRLLVGGVKSFVGQVPLGNTGGADVPPLRPMEIPADLKKIFAEK